MVEIGIIGYRNQATKLARLVEANSESKLKVIFHPSKNINDERGTNDFSKLLSCDGIIIASPNNTHYDYLTKLCENFDGYIFCEKPPTANLEELEKLKNFSIKNKQRIFFNFNLRYSELNKKIEQFKKSEDIERILGLNIIISHGLAFKNKYKNSWRSDASKNLHNILETLAIHYVDLLKWNFGEVENYSYFPTSNSEIGDSFDTSLIGLKFKNGITSSIFTSYSSSLINEMTIIGTNGYATFRENSLKIFSPRDTFDNDGFFVEPPIKFQENYVLKEKFQESLERAMNYFLSFVKNGKSIDVKQFDESLSTNELVFKFKTKI